MITGYKNLRNVVQTSPEEFMYAEVDAVHSILFGLLTYTRTITVYRKSGDPRWYNGDDKYTIGYDVERMYAQYLADDKALAELMAPVEAPE